jgi:hypothetical protein
MPEYKDTATRLREASKRNDLPSGIVALLSEAYADIEQLRAERDEARRNLCLTEAAILSFGPDGVPYHPSVAHKIAAEYGWDCFHNSNNQENDNGEE